MLDAASSADQSFMPDVNIDFSLLGVFFWNSHPTAKGAHVNITKNGIKYPFGTQVVTVAGKNYALLPQRLFHVSRSDPNFYLVIRNIEIIVGAQSRHKWGVRHVDLAQLEAEGEDYLRRLDAEGLNEICDTIRVTVQDSLDKENARRARAKLPPRDYTHDERRLLAVLKHSEKRLGQQGAHDRDNELAAIAEGAQVIPEFAADLKKLPIHELRKKAKAAKLLLKPDMNKAQIIALLKEQKAQQEREDAKKVLEVVRETHPAPADDDEDLLSQTVSVADGDNPLSLE